MWIGANGTPRVQLGQPAAWRTALQVSPNVSRVQNRRTTDVTTTTQTTIASLSHTTKTGKFIVMAQMTLKTSRNTSRVVLAQGTNVLAESTTNSTANTNASLFAFGTATSGTAVSLAMNMVSQDTETTATAPAYHTYSIMAVDIPT